MEPPGSPSLSGLRIVARKFNIKDICITYTYMYVYRMYLCPFPSSLKEPFWNSLEIKAMQDLSFNLWANSLERYRKALKHAKRAIKATTNDLAER